MNAQSNFFIAHRAPAIAGIIIAIFASGAVVLAAQEWPSARGGPGQTAYSPASAAVKPRQLWSFPAKDEILAAPAVDANYVYAASMDGFLYCLDRATGRLRWSFDSLSPIEASPALMGARVFLASLDGTVRALDAATGKELWRFATGQRVAGGPAPDGGTRIYVGSYDASLYCLDAASGKPLWSFPTGGYINGTPSLAQDSLVFGGCDAFGRSLSRTNGRENWRLETPSYIPGCVAVEGREAYILCYEGLVLRLDAVSGAAAWKADLSDRADVFPSSPALSPDALVAASRSGDIVCLERKSGKLLWQKLAGGQVVASPVIAGDTVLVVASDGSLAAYALANGQARWSILLGGQPKAQPALAGVNVYVGTQDGRLLAFGP